MNPLQEKALYHLTGQLDNNERAGQSLEKTVSNYPYFAPAQNLLACFYQANEHPSAASQASRATIYHFNPRWWAYQLEESREVADRWTSPVFESSDSVSSPLVDDSIQENARQFIAMPASNREPISIPTVEAVQAILLKIDGESIIDDKMPSPASPALTEEAESQKPVGKLSNLISSQLQAFQEPVSADSLLPFEQKGPMHTIDYFASQGIKVNWQTDARNKLSSKMLSFTDWLKQVKHNEKTGVVTQLENKVAEDANHSVRREEVVTEAMAEVLLRQGHKDQALQLFRKLSFQIPEKSSYFATRIEQIKSTL